MKATGMVRKVDHLGRLVLPMELRRNLGIGTGDPVEFYVDGELLILKQYDAAGSVEELVAKLEHEIRMKEQLLTPKQRAALDEKLQELKAIVKEKGADEDT